jgi:phage terminase large subunit
MGCRWRYRWRLSGQAHALKAQFPESMAFLFEPSRYKIAYGGRYGVKSWSFARALLLIAVQPSLLWAGRTAGPRILCARETQKSIEESVHRLLSDQIDNLGLQRFYTVQQTSISAANGAEFAFAGIRQNVNNMKSFEGFDIVWVEEAATVSKNSWNVLIPTIRKEGSEIWASFNPELEQDETYQRFIVNPPKSATVKFTTWRDNPWLTQVMRDDMDDLRRRNENDYNHVYEGQCKSTVEGAIYLQEILAAEKDQRLTRVPWDASHPVDTFWDLGFGDNTSIWFAQSVGFEFRIIDHLSGSLKGLQYYVKQLQERPYAYGRHVLPWDGEAKELGSGRSIQEQIGDTFGKDRVRCAKRLSVADGIAAVRNIFPKCYFDREKCADGIQSLRHYRYEQDDKNATFKREPLHDWASHDADAFRTLAVAIKEEQKPKVKAAPSRVSSGIRWG